MIKKKKKSKTLKIPSTPSIFGGTPSTVIPTKPKTFSRPRRGRLDIRRIA